MGVKREKMRMVHDAPDIQPKDFDEDGIARSFLIFINCNDNSASTFTYNLNYDVRVIDAWVVSAGDNASATAQVQDTDGNAITDAIACNSSKAVGRAGEIDDANWEEDAGNNLIVQQNANADVCFAFIVVTPRK